jgi:AcrR family transcriptional regulator
MAGVKGQVQRRGVERREAILDAAIEVFARSGFRGGAIAEIGERAGISAAGVLHHFGSKEALLAATLKERDRRTAAAEKEHFEQGDRSVRELVHFAELTAAQPGLARLHTALLVENLDAGSLHGYFVDRTRALQHWIAEALRAGQTDGRVRADVKPEAKAMEIVAFLEGASIVSQLDDGVSYVELVEGYVDDLLASLTTGY